MGRIPKEAECAEGGVKKNGTESQKKKNAAYVAAKFVFFDERKTVASGPGRQSGAWSCSERKVIASMEDYLEKSINIKVEIAALELLMEPEEAEVCLRYILKYAKRRCCSIFVIFDTKEKKKRPFCGVGAPRREGSLARKLAK